MEFGRREFSLDALQSDGSSLRQHADAIRTRTGSIPEEFESLPLPPIFSHVWSWFIELSRTRSSSGFGANPLNYNEIFAWSQLTGVVPSNIEVTAIMALDLVFMSVQAEEIRKRSQKNGRSS